MNELLIQTVILSAVIVVTLFVGIRITRTQQDQSTSADSESVADKYEVLQHEYSEQQELNSELKQKLASSASSIDHITSRLSETEAKCIDIQKSCNEQLAELSMHKAEVSKLQTQVEEKEGQLQQAKNDLSVIKNELSEKQNSTLQLSKLCAEQSEKLNQFDELRSELVNAKDEIRSYVLKVQMLSNENAEQAEKLKNLEELKTELSTTKQALTARIETISNLKSELSADNEAKRAMQEKIALLEAAEKRLVTQFENTANKIFKEKSGEFSQQSKQSMDALLSPLKQQIGAFSKQVSDVYTNEAKERHALKEEVTGLKALNEQMSKEATALTRALKGDNKKQGTWGEVVLERVLQESGLRKDHEYETQKNLKGEGGDTYKPDVIVHLPGNKDVVIDSKMALTAYERFFNAENDLIEAQALKEHVSAIKKHIKDLSGKNYQDLHGIKTLDYILMFIPVEPAFNAAIEHDPEIIQMALASNIMLVSPTNLMVALKTINNMWRIEHQNVNAKEIAKKAGAIYDKLVGFVEDMNKLGNHMQRAEGSYQEAMKKLSTGTGNLIRRAEQMKELRIGNNKALPETLVEQSGADVIAVNG